jgi:hypothetical protein
MFAVASLKGACEQMRAMVSSLNTANKRGCISLTLKEAQPRHPRHKKHILNCFLATFSGLKHAHV